MRELPPPESCPVCCSVNVVFTTNEVLYGRVIGDWPHIYFCNDCRASVGCHKGTKVPLGRMASAATKKLRVRAHAAFDPIWKTGVITRDAAYIWLANQLGIPPDECHISELSDEHLKQVVTVVGEYLKTYRVALERRKAKKDAKELDRQRRQLETAQRKRKTGKPRFARRRKRS